MYAKKDIPMHLERLERAQANIDKHPDWPQGLNGLIVADAQESLRLCGSSQRMGVGSERTEQHSGDQEILRLHRGTLDECRRGVGTVA